MPDNSGNSLGLGAIMAIGNKKMISNIDPEDFKLVFFVSTYRNLEYLNGGLWATRMGLQYAASNGGRIINSSTYNSAIRWIGWD